MWSALTPALVLRMGRPVLLINVSSVSGSQPCYWQLIWSDSVLMCKLVQVTLNARVVVVGASEVGISLLETLAFWFVSLFCDAYLLLHGVNWYNIFVVNLCLWLDYRNMFAQWVWCCKCIDTVVLGPLSVSSSATSSDCRLPSDFVNGHASALGHIHSWLMWKGPVWVCFQGMDLDLSRINLAEIMCNEVSRTLAVR